jgi:HEPN domain-containing protein
MKDETRQWLAFAGEDLAVGERLASDFPRSATWSYQQAAEKYIKALLIEQSIDFPKTHDCVMLLNLLPPLANETVLHACLVLARFGPLQRYPGGSSPLNAQDAQEAANAVGIIRAFCLAQPGLKD